MPDGIGGELADAVSGLVVTTSPWEVVAVVLAIAYLVLAIRERPG